MVVSGTRVEKGKIIWKIMRGGKIVVKRRVFCYV
jgi:hypothetical protein